MNRIHLHNVLFRTLTQKERLVIRRIALMAAGLLMGAGFGAVAAELPDFTELVEDNAAAVVNVSTTRRQNERDRRMRDFEEFFRRTPPQPPPVPNARPRSLGSGFVISDDGYVLTNNHVVDGADRVAVIFSDGIELEAEVIGTDPDSDLAVLELSEPKSGASPVDLGDSDNLRVGQIAVAIGNPFGQEFTMTTGIISALGRTIRSGGSPFSIPEVIQSDVAINPGNSGGPLLDRHGRVIGVNTQIISRSGASSGVGFSVPINTAKRVVPALIEEGRYEYSWLGISGSTLLADMAELMDLPRDTGGALVSQVTLDSPADKAGLRGSDRTAVLDGVDYPVGGDVIVSINGSNVDDMDDLIAYLSGNTRPGDKVTLEVIRDGERVSLEVTLGARPDSAE